MHERFADELTDSVVVGAQPLFSYRLMARWATAVMSHEWRHMWDAVAAIEKVRYTCLFVVVLTEWQRTGWSQIAAAQRFCARADAALGRSGRVD